MRADIGSLSPCFGYGPHEPWPGEAQARASRALTASHQAHRDAARRARGAGAGTRALIEILLAHRTMPPATPAGAMVNRSP
jgi:hypothetical protein